MPFAHEPHYSYVGDLWYTPFHVAMSYKDVAAKAR